ncbi:MAG: ABC transporter ATP-binding protein [bacterium]|nr:ABC transporter ATP-binding protein [bacterium]
MDDLVVLQVVGLKKKISRKWILRKVDFSVKKNTCHLILGPNGAGKTTTLKCILGIYKKYSGKIIFEGKDIRKVKTTLSIGYVPEVPYPLHGFKVREFLEMLARAAKKDWKFWLEEFGLWEQRSEPVHRLSKGQRKRLYFAAAFLLEPELLVLDEPFSGIDVDSLVQVKELIKRWLKERRSTFLLTSHLLAEVEELVDEVTVILNGTSVITVSVQKLLSTVQLQYELVFSQPINKQLLEMLESRLVVKDVRRRSVVVEVPRDRLPSLYELLAELRESCPVEVRLVSGSLYQLYKILRENVRSAAS